jgi:hypothetical protein
MGAKPISHMGTTTQLTQSTDLVQEIPMPKKFQVEVKDDDAAQTGSAWREIARKREAEIERLKRENEGLLQANRDCNAWFDALNSDHQKALKALDELARLGMGDKYGNSTGNRIAQDALASMID